jgi:hypothetical protein
MQLDFATDHKICQYLNKDRMQLDFATDHKAFRTK